jgi:secretion/DNA translocation related TadE-like protein
MRQPPARRSEHGSATVLALAAVGGLLACLVGGLAVASAVHAGHSARAGADLAALAAAAALSQGTAEGAACVRGGGVAAANGTTLLTCGADGDGSVTVEVAAPVGLRLPGLPAGPAVARARAGPAP